MSHSFIPALIYGLKVYCVDFDIKCAFNHRKVEKIPSSANEAQWWKKITGQTAKFARK